MTYLIKYVFQIKQKLSDFKSKRFQHDYRDKWIENINKAYFYNCQCKFDETKCKWNQWQNNNKCRCECKKHNISKKDYVWNPTTCAWEIGEYLTLIKVGSLGVPLAVGRLSPV